jgi:RNA-directed DNA polymerase
VHARKSQPHPVEKSRAFQRRLYRAAKRSGSRRFHALYDRIVRSDVLWRAWLEVRASRGAAGADGVCIADLECGDVEAFLEELASDLKAGKYRPQPVLRVEIPKPDGRLRPLGIPVVIDRLIQKALQQVLTPIFDPGFSDRSFGSRPGRSAHGALRQVQADAKAGYRMAVDLDLEKFFDRVSHDLLLVRVARRVADKRILSLIGRYLRAGVMVDGAVQPTSWSTPQGGPMTPRTQWATSSSSVCWRVSRRGIIVGSCHIGLHGYDM